jgi:hypothetical protein
MPRRHIEPFVDRDVPFKRMTLPGFRSGMHYKMLSIDADTGACTMTVQWDGGYSQPPSISSSELEILLLSGSFKLGERICRPGYYTFVPRGVSIPAIETRGGCQLLMMYNHSEPHITESDRDATGAKRTGLVSLQSYDDMPWQVPTLFPATEPGCLIKILHFDERTHAFSFLYTMNAGFWQDNISYHDCAEEAYHIWGTSWMMQFGNLPTGGYFWRPPYINHGAFACEKGTLAFGRTDGELYNHFHFHAHTTPAENQERAAARLLSRKPDLYKWVLSNGHNHPTAFDDPDHHHGHDHGHGPSHGKGKEMAHAVAHAHGLPHDHGDGNGHQHDHGSEPGRKTRDKRGRSR